MPFRAQCPTCDRAVNLAESERGSEIHCPNCDKSFTAGSSGTAAAGDASSYPAGMATSGLRRVSILVAVGTIVGVGTALVLRVAPPVPPPGPAPDAEAAMRPEVAEAVAAARELNN